MKRLSLSLVIWGIILISFGGFALSHDHFNMTVNGAREIVTPQNNPSLYWGMCLGPLFVGSALCVTGVYLMRKKEKDNTQKSGLNRRLFWNSIIWGVILIAFGAQTLAYGHFILPVNGARKIISPQNHPAAYWAICFVPLLVGPVLCAIAIYLFRQNKLSNDESK